MHTFCTKHINSQLPHMCPYTYASSHQANRPGISLWYCTSHLITYPQQWRFLLPDLQGRSWLFTRSSKHRHTQRCTQILVQPTARKCLMSWFRTTAQTCWRVSGEILHLEWRTNLLQNIMHINKIHWTLKKAQTQLPHFGIKLSPALSSKMLTLFWVT